MKTKEELCALKEEVEALSKKLNELSENELAEVTGGADLNITDWNGYSSGAVGDLSASANQAFD